MKESEAKSKVCPFKMAKFAGDSAEVLCSGFSCMGWTQWYDLNSPKPWTPRTPAEGDCGMKPPEEINVNNAY